MIFPTLKQLQYLTALHEHGHFGKAAEACFVTQSTLSAGLRELETALDVMLVERTKRVVRFTPVGEHVVRKAYIILREAAELTHLVKAASAPLTGDVRLGVIPTIAPFFLPKVLPKLRARYPSLRLYLREEMSHITCEALGRGQLDCVLLALPYACGDVEIMPLFEDPFYCAFHQDDVHASLEKILPDDIDNERLLLLEDGHCFKDQTLSACDRPELRADRALLATSLHTMVQMVDNKLGQTFLPKMALDAGILRDTYVIAKPFASERAKRLIALVWRKRSPREGEFRLLGQALMEGHAALNTASPSA
jgi:LysR family transcriptional regulator, hydrogen peroxide-inducible genes activator